MYKCWTIYVVCITNEAIQQKKNMHLMFILWFGLNQLLSKGGEFYTDINTWKKKQKYNKNICMKIH